MEQVRYMTGKRNHKPGETGIQGQHLPPVNTTIMPGVYPTRIYQCARYRPWIPPAELPLLFQKFIRLKRDLSGPVRGTGLGLYISKQFVEAMEGRIWVESAGITGQGSRFCVALPCPPLYQ